MYSKKLLLLVLASVNLGAPLSKEPEPKPKKTGKFLVVVFVIVAIVAIFINLKVQNDNREAEEKRLAEQASLEEAEERAKQQAEKEAREILEKPFIGKWVYSSSDDDILIMYDIMEGRIYRTAFKFQDKFSGLDYKYEPLRWRVDGKSLCLKSVKGIEACSKLPKIEGNSLEFLEGEDKDYILTKTEKFPKTLAHYLYDYGKASSFKHKSASNTLIGKWQRSWKNRGKLFTQTLIFSRNAKFTDFYNIRGYAGNPVQYDTKKWTLVKVYGITGKRKTPLFLRICSTLPGSPNSTYCYPIAIHNRNKIEYMSRGDFYKRIG